MLSVPVQSQPVFFCKSSRVAVCYRSAPARRSQGSGSICADALSVDSGFSVDLTCIIVRFLCRPHQAVVGYRHTLRKKTVVVPCSYANSMPSAVAAYLVTTLSSRTTSTAYRHSLPNCGSFQILVQQPAHYGNRLSRQRRQRIDS